MRWIDVTRPVSPALPVWPGDTPYSFELTWKLEEGASVNLGAIRSTTHLGTHADAPFHFQQDGAHLAQLPLEPFLGDAWVVDVRGRDLIGVPQVAHLTRADLTIAPRVLLRTSGWPVGSPFPEQVPVVTEALISWMADHGVQLLGVDIPSVDRIDSTTLENHHLLAGAGIHILENLNLEEVEAGRYWLTALPLRLEGADASPVRAVLGIR